LLKSINQVPDAITQLTALLKVSPTDAEAWAELADLYLAQGLLDQAIFCLEEVLLSQPNAWNVSYIANVKALGLTPTDACQDGRNNLHVITFFEWKSCRARSLPRRINAQISSQH
jgi:tetratricopeptide (TPR) repeat protein